MGNEKPFNSLEPNWVSIARAEIGVNRIKEYERTTILSASDDRVPWAACFVNWALIQGGWEGSYSSIARSFLRFGQDMIGPIKGAVAVLKGVQKWQGHVGFYLGEARPGIIQVLGGNGQRVGIEEFPTSDVLAFRWPKQRLKPKRR